MRLHPLLSRPPIQVCLLAGLALVLGTLSNLTASRQRRLGWLDSPVPPSTAARVEPVPPPALPQPIIQAPRPVAEPHPVTPRVAVKPPPPFPPDPANPVREVSSPEALKAFQAKVPFLDARRSGDYEQGHVAGAWCMPVWEADVDTRITVFEATAKLTSKDPIVLYCSGGDCEDSHMLAAKFLKLGYRNLLIYRAGFPDWQEQGRPARQGAQP